MTLHPGLRTALVPIAAIALALGYHFVVSGPTADPNAPRTTWRIGNDAAIEPFDEIPAETRIGCTLTTIRSAYVYLASYDLTRGCLAMLPSSQLRTDLPDNPLPAGRHELPGRHLGNELSWSSGDATGPVSFLLVVSDHALPDLENELGTLQQVGNAAFPNRPVLGNYAPPGGMDSVPPRSELPTPVLRAAFELQNHHHDGPLAEWRDGIWLGVLRVRVAHGAANLGNVEDMARDKLRRQLGPLIAPSTPK